MPVAPPIAESSRDPVLSEHSQLLTVCLLLGLFLCGAIFLYSNQVKGKAALLAQDSYAKESSADMTPSSNIPGTKPVPGTVAIDGWQHSDASLNGRLNTPSGIAVSHKSATNRGGRSDLASQRVKLGKPGLRKLSQPPTARGSTSLALSRSRSRSSFPSRYRTTLIALWRQSLKRHQADKLGHLTSNPST